MKPIRSSIRNKMIALLLLATVIPFGASIFFSYTHTKQAIIKQTMQENLNLLSEGQKNISAYLNRINTLSLSIYNSTEMITLMENGGVSYGDNAATGYVTTALLTLLHANEDIAGVNLYLQKSGQMFAVSPSTLQQAQQRSIPYRQIYRHALDSPYHSYIVPPSAAAGGETGEPAAGSPDTIAFQRVYIDYPKDDILGFLTIEVKLATIRNMCRDLFIPGNSEFLLLNREGAAVFASAADGDSGAERDWLEAIERRPEASGIMQWKDGRFNGFMFFDKMAPEDGGWVLVKQIPFQALYQTARSTTLLNILIGILAIVLVLVATLVISVRITSPLQVLVRNIRKIKQGRFSVDFDSLGADEIGVLGNQFKSMVEQIDNLMIKEYHLQLENKTNQLQTLQSQLNPHFLNNALQSISSLAYENQDFRVHRLIRALSKMMRYSMDMTEKRVPLYKEFDYVRAYLELQKQRFEERLSVEVELDERCRNWSVPKMIVQPLAENYFKHAFDWQGEAGRLRIRAALLPERDGERGEGGERRLEITVQDNGCGMDEAELARLMGEVEQEQADRTGAGKIGLVNLFKRLALYYGGAAEYAVDNRPGQGMRIRLVLPESFKESGAASWQREADGDESGYRR